MIPVSRRSVLAGVASVLLSALLIFLLEPIAGRLLLPTYGGSAAVWNTSLMVFQLLLLVGYLYAHLISTRLSRSRGILAHLALLALSIAFLPPALNARQASEGWPVGSIVMALVTGIGLPFLVLSANTVITQRWLADAGMKNPFWLYAASNTGSLAALIAYPLLVEPLSGLRQQVRGWTVLYALFIGMTALLAFLTFRAPAVVSSSARGPLVRRVGRNEVLVWVILSAVPSSLLMSTTLQVSTEAGSAPLFWVIPLAIYLGTFIIAFSTRRVPPPVLYWGTAVTMAAAFFSILNPVGLSLPVLAILAGSTLFFGALFCHSALAERAPEPALLTTFYLWIAVGGLLGGTFNALLAPVLFRSVAEYPLTLLVLALVLVRFGIPAADPEERGVNRFGLYAPVVLPIAALVVAGALVMLGRAGYVRLPESPELFRWEMMPLAAMLFAIPFARNRRAFLAAALFSSWFVMLDLSVLRPPVEQLRSFYGVAKVLQTPIDRRLVHGATLHGSQSLFPEKRRIASTYYHREGPLGFALTDLPEGATVGVVGLGAGSLAALGQPGQMMYFYEIDPVVVELALRHFSYVADSPARVFFVVGDGRKEIERMTDVRFDVLIVDAFSGDAVPSHLLTSEAIDLYLQRMKPDGLLLFHISSRYANLARVLRGWSLATGRPVVVSRFDPTRPQKLEGATRTIGAAVAPSPERLREFARSSGGLWRPLSLRGPSVLWTDDSTDLVGVLWRPAR